MLKKDVSSSGHDPSSRPPTWMRDIRKKLQRDMLVRQAQPGMATQAKVHYALQVRRRAQGQREPDELLSPSMIPFTDDEVNRLLRGGDGPNGGKGGQRDGGPRTVGTHQLSVIAKLTDAVAREMDHRGFDALSAQMLTSYIVANPAAIDAIRRELKAERQHRRRERASVTLGHDHVLPEELIFGSRGTAFPKAPMEASNNDLTSTRTGSVSKILKNCATTIEEEKSELDPITVFVNGERPRVLAPLRTVGRNSAAAVPSTRGSVLGDHFPIYMCQGIPITFDPPTIATLTAQGGRATEAIVAQQTADVGALEMMSAAEEVRVLRALHAPKAQVVTAKVFSGRHSVPLRSDSRGSGSVDHDDPTTDPRHSVGIEELLTIACAVEASQSLDAEKRHGAPAARVVEAPEGLLKQLLRDVDSDSECSDDGLLHPRCVVCHSLRGKKPNASRHPLRNLRDSSRNAQEALLRWKALHQWSQREATSSLASLLASRDEHSRVVTQNLGALAQVTAKAKRDAEDWMRSRSGATPSPTGQSGSGVGGSVWDGPCNHITTQRARWHGCVLFWERLRQFLELLQWPSNEGQLEIVHKLQHIVETLKCLSPCVLLLWLHACGPQLCRVREYYRVLVFVRCALAIPQSAFHAWIKLPQIKHLGFEIATD